VVSGVAGFGEDLLNLVELQARLAAIELRHNLNAVKTGGAVVLAASILAIASVPVALTGIAELLASELGLGHGLALVSVAAAAILIAVLCAAFAWTWLRRQRLGFPLSGEESVRNLNWFRTVLRRSGRSPSRR
jgi:uncharacterized membrane protein